MSASPDKNKGQENKSEGAEILSKFENEAIRLLAVLKQYAKKPHDRVGNEEVLAGADDVHLVRDDIKFALGATKINIDADEFYTVYFLDVSDENNPDFKRVRITVSDFEKIVDKPPISITIGSSKIPLIDTLKNRIIDLHPDLASTILDLIEGYRLKLQHP